MDYEKKYNEALSQARFYYGNCPTEPEKKKLENIFPELRESEDERIRKELVDFVNHYRHNTDLTSEQAKWCKNVLAWLEKYKEIIATIRAEIESRKEAILSCPENGIVTLEAKSAIRTMANGLLSFLSDLEKSAKPTSSEEAMKELDEKIALVKQRGTWDGVDVDKYMDELRGREKSEKPIQEDLEKEIEKFLNETGAPYVWCNDDEQKEWCSIIARHFYELGKRSGSSEIPKDARIAAEQFYPQDCFDSQAVRELGIDCFVDGAKWQAEHQPLPEDTVLFNKGVEEGKRLMMEEAVEATLDNTAYPTRLWFNTYLSEYSNNDKVRVIIIKKED